MHSLLLRLIQPVLQIRRPRRIWKETSYGAIPHFNKPHFIDEHDTYQLRSIEEVKAELKGKPFELIIERTVYRPTDLDADMKGRKAVLTVKLDQFKLTEHQLSRLKVLVGCRYNPETNTLRMACEMFDNFEQNQTKVHEMFYELMMEAKRAP